MGGGGGGRASREVMQISQSEGALPTVKRRQGQGGSGGDGSEQPLPPSMWRKGMYRSKSNVHELLGKSNNNGTNVLKVRADEPGYGIFSERPEVKRKPRKYKAVVKGINQWTHESPRGYHMYPSPYLGASSTGDPPPSTTLRADLSLSLACRTGATTVLRPLAVPLRATYYKQEQPCTEQAAGVAIAAAKRAARAGVWRRSRRSARPSSVAR